MATITKQIAVPAGIALTFGAANSGGDQFLNTGKEVLIVKNGDSTATTVTITGQRACNQGTTHSQAISVAASAEEVIGPLNPYFYNDANGYVQITYSKVTSLTEAVVTVSL